MAVRKSSRGSARKRNESVRIQWKALPKKVANELRQRFITEYKLRWQGSQIIASIESQDAGKFLRRLEGLASSHATLQVCEPPFRQTRKEQLDALGNRLANLADDLHDLDTGALGYWLHLLARKVQVTLEGDPIVAVTAGFPESPALGA